MEHLNKAFVRTVGLAHRVCNTMIAMRWLSLVFLAFAASASAQVDFLREAMPLDKDAVVLMSAEQASGTAVEEVIWSSDGKYLLIKRSVSELSTTQVELMAADGSYAPTVHHQIAVYSASTGKVKVLGDVTDPTVIDDCEWMNGSNTAVVVLREPQVIDGKPTDIRSTSLLAADGSSSLSLGRDVIDFATFTYMSPNRPIGVLVRENNKTECTVRFLGPKGLLKTIASVPVQSGVVEWGEGGGVPYMRSAHRGPDGRLVREVFRIDPESGTVTKVPRAPVFETNTTVERLALNSKPMVVGTEKVQAYARVVWLDHASGERGMLVTTDGEQAELAPRETAVSYRSRGALVVRRIGHISLEAYHRSVLIALKKKAISDAKQVAIAFMMLANDYDDTLPGNGPGWREKLGPYLKNAGLADGFTYTFAGGSMLAIQLPASTPIGFISVSGGQAVAYADGHVKWLTP